MRYRYRLDQKIARMAHQLDMGYVRTAQDATNLCQRLLGRRCQACARWLTGAVWLSLGARVWRVFRH